MLKSNLSLHLNLSKLSLVGFANLLLLPVLSVHSTHAQSVSYSCQSSSGGFATIGRSTLGGTRTVITWDNRQPLCNDVSARFQVASGNGNLRFLMREGNRVCGTNMDGGECISLLFSTDSAPNANDLWRRLMGNNTISSRYITQSGEVEYFNLELYLETVPSSTNQEISTSQLSSQP